MSHLRYVAGALGAFALIGGSLTGSGTRAEATPPALLPVAGNTGGTVALELVSAVNGQTVAPGQEVPWRIRCYVSTGDNLGLALISVDLVQEKTNPELFDIPAGAAVTTAMRAFDRPDGFTNPPEDPTGNPEGSGYGGSRIGEIGSKDLLQIGGAQNTFGRIGPCFGPNNDVCMGQDIAPDTGVGQGLGGETVAFGTLAAPSTPGTYVFRIQNALANTLEAVNAAPAASVTQSADIRYLNTTWTFTVQ